MFDCTMYLKILTEDNLEIKKKNPIDQFAQSNTLNAVLEIYN